MDECPPSTFEVPLFEANVRVCQTRLHEVLSFVRVILAPRQASETFKGARPLSGCLGNRARLQELSKLPLEDVFGLGP